MNLSNNLVGIWRPGELSPSMFWLVLKSFSSLCLWSSLSAYSTRAYIVDLSVRATSAGNVTDVTSFSPTNLTTMSLSLKSKHWTKYDTLLCSCPGTGYSEKIA